MNLEVQFEDRVSLFRNFIINVYYFHLYKSLDVDECVLFWVSSLIVHIPFFLQIGGCDVFQIYVLGDE